jgi:hypothetical protein
MSSNVERIQLGDGQWWEFKKELTVGDDRKIADYARSKSFELMQELKQSGMGLGELRSMADESKPATNGDRPSTTDEDVARLLFCTVAWSFKDEVNEEGLNERSKRHADMVLAGMASLYDLDPETVKN